MTSGLFLRQLRENKNFSLRQVSIKSGVSHTQIADVEKGINYGTKDRLDKILIALDATKDEIEYFYNLQDYEKTPESIKKRLNECKNKLHIANNSNNGPIIVGNQNYTYGNNFINSDNDETDDILIKEIQMLTKNQKEKVLKFINEYIK